MPAVFSLTSKTQTKVTLSIIGDNFSYNKVIPADTTITVPFDKTISFDLWSAQHISANIGNISLDGYFNDEDVSIRGWFDTQNSILVFTYFNH